MAGIAWLLSSVPPPPPKKKIYLGILDEGGGSYACVHGLARLGNSFFMESRRGMTFFIR